MPRSRLAGTLLASSLALFVISSAALAQQEKADAVPAARAEADAAKAAIAAAKADLERLQSLVKERAASAAELDAAKARLAGAVAELSRAVKRRGVGAAEVDAARARLQAVLARQRQADLALEGGFGTEAEAQQARADVAVAKAVLEATAARRALPAGGPAAELPVVARAQVQAARAKLEAQLARLDRVKKLLAQGIAPQVEAEQAQAEVEAAKAELVQAQKALEAAPLGLPTTPPAAVPPSPIPPTAANPAVAPVAPYPPLRAGTRPPATALSPYALPQPGAAPAMAPVAPYPPLSAGEPPAALPAASSRVRRPRAAADVEERFESPRDVAEARLTLAQEQYRLLLESHRAGQSVDDEELYLWSKRWMEAEQHLARRKSGRLAAAEAHLDRIRGLEEVARARYDAGIATAAELGSARYHRLEAEEAVLEMKR